MGKILIPTKSPDDWKMLLADPERHWKRGYSARSLAYCWEDADGIPSDVHGVLAQLPILNNLETIFALNIRFLYQGAQRNLKMMFGF